MSLLTSKIRKIIGKGSNTGGRCGRFLLSQNGSFDKEGRYTVEETNQLIDDLSESFETYIAEFDRDGCKSTLRLFFVYNSKTNEYVGSCKMYEEVNGECFFCIGYSYLDKETIIKSVKRHSGFVSINKI